MVFLATCSDLHFLDDRHATPCNRGDEFEQVSRAEPQVQPEMVVRITDGGVAYKEIVNWCARSTFYSEKAAWREFDRRTNGCLHVTAYNPMLSPGKSPTNANSAANQFVGRTDLDYQESPAPLTLSPGGGGSFKAVGVISPKHLHMAGDATWDGGTHLVISDSTYSGDVAEDDYDEADTEELHVTLPGHDIAVAENPCCMCAQEAGQERCPGCHVTMCYMCISFFNKCSQCTSHVRSAASTPKGSFMLQNYALPVPPASTPQASVNLMSYASPVPPAPMTDPRASGAGFYQSDSSSIPTTPQQAFQMQSYAPLQPMNRAGEADFHQNSAWSRELDPDLSSQQDPHMTVNVQHQQSAHERRGPRPVPDPFRLGYPQPARGHLHEQMQNEHQQQQQQVQEKTV